MTLFLSQPEGRCSSPDASLPHRRRKIIPLALFALSFCVYLRTLAPTITWSHEGADGGDLITAACTLGIPHPTGYPTYVLLARLFIALPFGDVAYRVNLMSAFFAAGTVALLYLSALSLLNGGSEGEGKAVLAAASAALTFAFSPLFWSQALIAEVYALNAFFAAGLIYLLLKLRGSGGHLWLSSLFAFSFGLALGNHLSIILLAAALPFLFRRAWPPLKGVVFPLLAFALGLGVYSYLPLRAREWPPLNWGAPYTGPRLWWLVSGQLYHPHLFALPWSHLPGRLLVWAGLLGKQFAWWGVPPGLVGLGDLYHRERGLFSASLAFFLLISAYAIGYDTSDSYLYLIPAFLTFALWVSRGLHLALEVLLPPSAARLLRPGIWKVLPAGLLLLPFLSLALNFSALDLSADRAAREYGLEALEAAAPGAVILAAADAHTFALWYFRYAEGRRADVAVLQAGLLQHDWYVENLRHLHPALALPPGEAVCLEDLVSANLSRPLYLTDAALLPGEGYALEATGPLYRVIAPSSPPQAGKG